MAIKFNQNFDVNRVVKRLVRTVLALYIGGTIMSVFGDVMHCTSGPFYTGLSLIGWTTGTVNATTISPVVVEPNCTALGATMTANTIINQGGSGVLAVVGIIAIAQIVTEFISW